MKELPLNALRAFAAVYETGGIRPAGRRLGIAHSSISRHLKELSAWIDAPLFETETFGAALVLTAEGEALGKSLLGSFNQMDTAVIKVRESSRANNVTLSTTPSLAMRWLLPHLPEFEALYPAVEVSLIVDQQRQSLRKNGIDIAIRMGAPPSPTAAGATAAAAVGAGSEPDVDYVPLMSDRLFPVMSPSFWHASGSPKHPDDLVGMRLLHDRDPNTSWQLWHQAHGPPSLDVRRGSRFTSSDLVLRAAEQGMGVALAREKLVQPSIDAGTLMRPMGDLSVDLPNAYWLITQHKLMPRKVVMLMRDWLISTAQIH